MKLGTPIFLSHTRASYGASASLAALRHSLFPDSFLVSPPLRDAEKATTPQNRIAEVDMPWAMIHHYEWRPRTILRWFSRYLRARKQLGLIFRAQRPAFVHSNSALLSVGAEIAGSQGVPHLWHLREFGDLDYDLQWFLPRAWHQRLLRKAAALICVSRSVAEHHGVAGWSKTHVLYNGVMMRDQMGFLKTGRSSQEPFSFGCVGILSDAKGFDLAIRAMSKCEDSNSELLIFGDGPDYMREKLQDEATRCGVSSKVRFEGFVKDNHQIYGRIDCLLVTSRYEAFGRTTAEAMALGVPIIGRNSGGTAELIEHAKDGLLFEGSEEELATRMNEVRRNYAQALTRSERGLTKARAAFSIEAYADGFRRIAAPFA